MLLLTIKKLYFLGFFLLLLTVCDLYASRIREQGENQRGRRNERSPTLRRTRSVGNFKEETVCSGDYFQREKEVDNNNSDDKPMINRYTKAFDDWIKRFEFVDENESPSAKKSRLLTNYRKNAIDCILLASSSHKTLDLHRLHVREAVAKTNEFIDRHLQEMGVKKELSRTVYIITGKGLHSVDNVPKIKPAVETLLSNKNIQFEPARDFRNIENPGKLAVTLSLPKPETPPRDRRIGS